MLRLAHISDLHYSDSFRVPLARLACKRIAGYVNLVLHRRLQHDPDLGSLLLESLRGQEIDHLAVTGDLTNLSLGKEFSGARRLLLESGLTPDEITVIPGNHDRYTGGSERSRRFEGYLSPFMRSDIPLPGGGFPLVRLRDGVALIGLNTALSQPPLVAGGKIGVPQGTRLEVLMGHGELRGRFPVFLLHHPPFREMRGPLHYLEGLRDYRRFLDAVTARGALMLHGHLHRSLFGKIETGGKTFWIGGAASTTFKLEGSRSLRISSYTIFDIDREGIKTVRRFTLNRRRMAYEPREIGLDEFRTIRP